MNLIYSAIIVFIISLVMGFALVRMIASPFTTAFIFSLVITGVWLKGAV